MLNDSEWRYYRLAQMEHTSPGSHLGHWRLMTDTYSTTVTGDEITEWASSEVRFFHTHDSHILMVGVHPTQTIESVAERISERIGSVEVA